MPREPKAEAPKKPQTVAAPAMRGEPAHQGFTYLNHFRTGRARTVRVKES